MAIMRCLECGRNYDPQRDGGDQCRCQKCCEQLQKEFDSLPDGSYSAIDDD